MSMARITMGKTLAETLEALGIKERRGRGWKYGAKPVQIDNIEFASQAEGKRYCELKILRDAGKIMELEVHPLFRFVVNGVKVGRYNADFSYHDLETGKDVVEDVKGRIPLGFSKTKRLMRACHGIDVVVIGGPRRRKRRRKAK
jgi:hypothetical protein